MKGSNKTIFEVSYAFYVVDVMIKSMVFVKSVADIYFVSVKAMSSDPHCAGQLHHLIDNNVAFNYFSLVKDRE
jgi:hypothetical protein